MQIGPSLRNFTSSLHHFGSRYPVSFRNPKRLTLGQFALRKNLFPGFQQNRKIPRSRFVKLRTVAPFHHGDIVAVVQDGGGGCHLRFFVASCDHKSDPTERSICRKRYIPAASWRPSLGQEMPLFPWESGPRSCELRAWVFLVICRRIGCQCAWAKLKRQFDTLRVS